MVEERFRDNLLLNISLDFAVAVLDYSERLVAEKHYIIARQLFRSCSSIGANLMEAQNAESKADFIHKLKISAKEADEAQFWLKVCQRCKHYPNSDDLYSKLIQIQKILNASIETSKLSSMR